MQQLTIVSLCHRVCERGCVCGGRWIIWVLDVRAVPVGRVASGGDGEHAADTETREREKENYLSIFFTFRRRSVNYS